jgi:hypothetical protein
MKLHAPTIALGAATADEGEDCVQQRIAAENERTKVWPRLKSSKVVSIVFNYLFCDSGRALLALAINRTRHARAAQLPAVMRAVGSHKEETRDT